jgi:serine/threonine protein kinase
MFVFLLFPKVCSINKYLCSDYATYCLNFVEYGMGGEISVDGDVYSYGVMLLEMFTGKKPTDGMFQGNHTLQFYVATNYPGSATEIVDPTLLHAERCRGSAKLQQCVVAVFHVGLQCMEESPRIRMSIKEAIKELLVVKQELIG